MFSPDSAWRIDKNKAGGGILIGRGSHMIDAALSMEVTLRPGEDEKTVLANTKRVLKRAWALLED